MEYEATDGNRETVVLTPDEVETLDNDEDTVVIDTESVGEVELYHAAGSQYNYGGTGANSNEWGKLLTGEKEEMTWYHIPLRVVLEDEPSEKTVKFGDTEVIVRETDGGYEAIEVENNAISFIDSKGNEAHLHADAEFEVTVATNDEHADNFGDLVVGYDCDALTDDSPNRGNRLDTSQLDGEWERMRYFDEMKEIRE